MSKNYDQRSAPPWVGHTLRLWHQLEVWIAVLAYSAIAVILVYDVISREVLVPALGALGLGDIRVVLYGSQKLAVYLLVFGSFAGIGIATWTGAQLIPQVGFKAVPASWNDFMNRMADIVTALLLCGLTYIAAKFVGESFASGQQGSGGLQIPIWKVQIAIPIGFASAAIRYWAFVIWPQTRPENVGGME